MQYILDTVPILLAIYAAVVCSRKYAEDRRKHTKRVLALGVAGAILLIIAQTSWYVSSDIFHNTLGTWFADQIWTIFNSVTMVAFILLAHGGTTNVEKPTSARD